MSCETVRRFSFLLVIGLLVLGQGCSSTGGGGNSPASGPPETGDGNAPPTPVDSTDSEVSSNGDEPPITDDDSAGPAGISINAAPALSSTEAGGTAQFSVVLDRAPAAEVNLPIASTNIVEAAVSPSTLTFTPANWSTPQSVTISGADDFVDDGDVVLTVTVGPAVSADPDSDGLEAAGVTVTNRDNDTAGVTVLADPDAATSEARATATFTIVLNSQPTDEVTIAIGSSPTSELEVAPAAVTFNSENWDDPQTVTLTGLDDALQDGDVTVMVVTEAAVSADAAYSGMAVADVTVINRDDDSQSFTIEPDDFPAGTVLENIVEAVSLSVALNDNSIADFDVTAAEDGLDLEPTGERVFGHEGIQFFNSDRRLRLDFTQPAREIRLTFAGGTFFETEVGVLQAFDANGAMLAEYTTSPREAGDPEVMTIARPTADIAWAVAYSQDSFGRLDYLVITVAIAP